MYTPDKFYTADQFQHMQKPMYEGKSYTAMHKVLKSFFGLNVFFFKVEINPKPNKETQYWVSVCCSAYTHRQDSLG